jgi:hypothetical protein
MKYSVSFLVAVAVLYLYAAQHPVPGSPISLWVDALGGAIILTLPASLICRLLTKKVKGLRARAIDLIILLCVVGIYWAVSISWRSDAPRVPSLMTFWLRLTLTTWTTVFLPFGLSITVFESLESRRSEKPNQSSEPTPPDGAARH